MQSRAWRRGFSLLSALGAFWAVGCGRLGFELPRDLACAEIDCDGHGRCGVTGEGSPICACDSGYHNQGDTACVLDEPIAPPVFLCNPAGWCWDNPLPQGNPLSGVWSPDGVAIWAVGAAGTVLYRPDPQSDWQLFDASASSNLHAIWGEGPARVWAVGGPDPDVLLEWDGLRWTAAEHGLGCMHDLAGEPGGDKVAVGEDGVVLRWTTRADIQPIADGVSGQDLAGLALLEDGQVWAVGDEVLLHFDGSDWQTAPGAAGRDLRAVWCRGDSLGWAAGAAGAVLELVSASSWLAQSPPTDQDLEAVWGNGQDAVWFAGSNGTVLRFDGTDFTAEESGTLLGLSGLWGVGDRLWAVGDGGQILQREAGGWSRLSGGVRQNLFALWGSTADDVWASGTGGAVLHWDGESWSHRPIGVDAFFAGLWGDGAGTVWCAGEGGRIYRYSASSGAWYASDSHTGEHLLDLDGSGVDDVWAVGTNGIVLRWDGADWVQVPSGTSVHLFAVCAPSAEQVWIAGMDGELRRLVGGAFEQVDIGRTEAIEALWAYDSDEIWIAGWRGLRLRWDGTQLVDHSFDSDVILTGVWGSGPDDVWVVGGAGDVWHYDGGAWSKVPTGLANGLYDVWAAPDGSRVWIAGWAGSLLHR